MRISIVGGCGHVGLPLGIALANKGADVKAIDINSQSVSAVNSGRIPFFEEGAVELLRAVIEKRKFSASTDLSLIKDADAVIVVIGTPIDEHMNPDHKIIVETIKECLNYMTDNQLLILRSTVFPGTTKFLEQLVMSSGLKIDVVFAPERILEGKALAELGTLPQIIGARTLNALAKGKEIFELLGVDIIETTPEEAEFIKLFTNSWRYIKFAIANQFWLIANEAGLEYSKIRDALIFNYPRALDLPTAGFAAGPCLLKDTMQLSAYSSHNFTLGNAAVQINEGQPLYLVEKLSEKYDLSKLTIGILGMAFKGGSDDTRSSLAYKLKKILEFRSVKVLTSDPYVTDDHEIVNLEEVLNSADVLVIAAPHGIYEDFISNKPIIDIWNLRKGGSGI